MEPSTERWDRRVPECLVPACHLPKGPQLEPGQSLQFPPLWAQRSPRPGDSSVLSSGTEPEDAVPAPLDRSPCVGGEGG